VRKYKLSVSVLVKEKRYESHKKKSWSGKKVVAMLLGIIATSLTLVKPKRES
jgi:hypothetical protein